MLKELQEYAHEHLGESEPGLQPKDIRWAVCFSAEGRFLGVVEIGQVDQKRNPGRRFDRCPNLSQPEMKAGGTPKCHFLADTAGRLVLLDSEAQDSQALARFEFHLRMLRQAAATMPALDPLAHALSDPGTLGQVQTALTAAGVKPGDKITFQVAGEFPLESEAWHDWWREFRRTIKPAAEGRLMRCLVTGEPVVPARTHDTKIKGLASVGGRGSGDVLIGFDKEAFESYGLRQSENAACSEEAAAQYCLALNDLISAHSRRVADALVVHWFRHTVSDQDDPLSWLYEMGDSAEEGIQAQHRARELLEAIRNGSRPDLAGNRYFALTLSGNAGRAMVRDWMEGAFEDLVANVNAWFDDLAIVRREGGRLAPEPKFLAVLAATVRSLDDLAAPVVARLWRVAARAEPIPRTSMAQALLRARMDVVRGDSPNHARMGLLKAYHLREDRRKGGDRMSDLQPYLNEQHPSPAYQCGRLLAILASLQRAALGDVGAGVVQRYYASASTTPSLVLGRLMRTAQFHLNKLEGGLAWWYEQKLAEVAGRLGNGIPRTLNLENQSLFALGYYQQLADMRTKKVIEDDHTQEVETNV